MNNLIKPLKPIISIFVKYGLIIFIVTVGATCIYIVYTSSRLVAVEPSQKEVQDKYKATKRPKLEERIADKINELEDRNVKFQTLIDEARDNPFAE